MTNEELEELQAKAEQWVANNYSDHHHDRVQRIAYETGFQVIEYVFSLLTARPGTK